MTSSLAATQSRSTTLRDLIQIAEEGTDDLARRGGQPRQRSLDAVLAWSLDCLPPPRRASLLALSILPGRFDLEMAITILDAVDGCETHAVRHLAQASLIDLDGESYRILDTIRHAARRHLANDPDLAAAARLGLRAWAQQLAAALYREQRRFDDIPLDRVLALETALEQAMDDGASGLGKVWELVSLIAHCGEPSVRIVDLANRLMSGPLPADADDDLGFAGAINLLLHVGAVAVADDRLEAICAAADGHGVSPGSGYLHFNLAFHYGRRGDLRAARRHADAYLPFAASPAADATDRRMVHHLHGMIAQAAGEPEEALRHAERALIDARESDSNMDFDVALVTVAEVLLDLSRPEEALPLALEALRMIVPPGPLRRFKLAQVARAHAQLGNTEAAHATAREVEAELLASGRPRERIQAELAELRRKVPALAAAPATQTEA
ncbi:tetratricopeptide repeat protein [Nocardioides immobilis]|uniref:Tetratricopeptide repeat protein n=1 Tax=Nocardioides immobilis TaxID=2049295 RepID=A0A417Y3L8_9ACTN|nr:tetratricopeptide repeat protein [Nocardioides immobilis]RHW27263.1 tetratricopeptide repeat protein [Nocardioides immobilis]